MNLPMLYVLVCFAVLLVSAQTVDRDSVQCGLQQKICECREDAEECEFTLVIEELQTFVSYTKEEYNSGGTTRLQVGGGNSYYFNSSGQLTPLSTDDEKVCVTTNEDFEAIMCTVPMTVDGKTYRPIIAINGLSPGPTLIVYEGQVMVVNVVSKLITESMSIHWHGMHMRNTPWMDGVTLVTQCPINPFETFQYYFKAAPTGTFWYHSHDVKQRVDGLFGGLTIRESAQRRDMLESVLGGTVVDEPGTQTVHIQEWAESTTLYTFTKIKGELDFFPGKPCGEIPVPLSEQNGTSYTAYEASSGPDGLEVGDLPFRSALINGKGRHINVPYAKTRLEVFSINDDQRLYRFRLVGAQGLYAYKFSIDEHNLTLIASDGFLIEPVETQFIIVHTGERFDFVIRGDKPRADVNDYWIRAQTLEVDLDSPGPPYPSTGNIAEGILHYRQDPEQIPQSTSYESIKQNSIAFDSVQCGVFGGCIAINCPFRSFHPSYNISQCINAHELIQLEPTPAAELPEAEVDSTCEDCEIILNIGSDHDTMNGFNMQLPPAPPLTQRDDLPPSQFCDLTQPCPNNEPCSCTHLREIRPFNKTIRLVISSVGQHVLDGDGFSHPFHLHGHHFQIVDVGYGPYNGSTGFLEGHRNDIICNDALCSSPAWAPGMRPTFEISNKTVRKDTVIVPGGGYVVLHFRSDNPGLWLLHCHIFPDLLEGMSVMLNEVEDEQNPAPTNINRCGNFNISQSLFYEKLAFDSSSGARGDGIVNTVLPTFAVVTLSLFFALF